MNLWEGHKYSFHHLSIYLNREKTPIKKQFQSQDKVVINPKAVIYQFKHIYKTLDMSVLNIPIKRTVIIRLD